MALIYSFLVMAASVLIVASRPHRPTFFDLPDANDDQIAVSSSRSKNQGRLAACDPCPAGWGVKSMCNTTSNTVCSPCPPGFWSPKRSHFRPCSTCSKCGDGLFEDLPCTSIRDTQCDSCLNSKGHLNEDYKKKCDWRRAPESMKAIDDDDGEDDTDRKLNAEMIELIRNRLKNWRVNAQQKANDDLKIDGSEIHDDLAKKFIDHKIPHAVIGNWKLGVSAIDDQKSDVIDGTPVDSSDIDEQKIDDSQAGDDSDDNEDLDQSMDEKNAGDTTPGQGIDENTNVAAYMRVMQLRHKAQQAIAEISRFQEDSDVDDDNEDEEEKNEETSRISKLHMMRPFPQLVPTRKDSIIDPLSSGNDWHENPVNVAQDQRPEVNYPPSYHSYPIDALMHSQRRKAVILVGLTCLMVVSAFVFILLFVRAHRKQGKAIYNRVATVNLSPEEREIVRHSATQLAQVDKPVKKFHLSHNGYSTLINADSAQSLAIRENPLDAYLNGESGYDSELQKSSNS